MSKGRDKNLIEKRDEALLKRFHYWTEVQRLRLDDAVRVLSQNEFFISEERVLRIIRQKCHLVDGIIKRPVIKIKTPAWQRSLFD